MKKIYTSPKIDIVKLSDKDVIQTSGLASFITAENGGEQLPNQKITVFE